MRKVFSLLVGFAFMLNRAGVGYAGHKDEKGMVKGTITKMEPSEYAITVKDDKRKETKVNVKDARGLKVGDSVVVKDGKIAPAVKPRTGGY